MEIPTGEVLPVAAVEATPAEAVHAAAVVRILQAVQVVVIQVEAVADHQEVVAEAAHQEVAVHHQAVVNSYFSKHVVKSKN